MNLDAALNTVSDWYVTAIIFEENAGAPSFTESLRQNALLSDGS